MALLNTRPCAASTAPSIGGLSAGIALALAAGIALPLALAGCIGTSPQEDEPAVQGDYEDGDEEHRPGQPCLLCHGAGHLGSPPGGDVFVLAGTVFSFIDDNENDGISNVRVTITDAEGFEFSARSNRAGNFMFNVDTGSADVRERNQGRTTLPRAPTYPLSVKISRSADEQEMKTKIWREGSCAHCHGPAPDRASVGRVYLFEETPP